MKDFPATCILLGVSSVICGLMGCRKPIHTIH
jgi:hypothetical protein